MPAALRHAGLLLLLPTLLAAEGVEVARREGANLQRPSWSPGATQLSYEANFHDTKTLELYVGPPEGPGERVRPPALRGSALTAGFTKAPAGQVVHELSWSPPSFGRYVYAATTESQDYDLFVGGGGAVTATPGADGGPAWSPDGRWIAFTSSRTGEGDVYLLDVQDLAAAPRRVTDLERSAELYVDWSPNSQSLVFVAHTPAGDNLWLVPELEGSPAQLTSWPGNQTRPRFSSDGRLVAFYADHDEPGRLDLWVMAPEVGATPRKVLEDVRANAMGPSWIPGTRDLLVVAADDARFDPILRVSAEGGDPTLLELGTIGHGDLDVARDAEGRLRLAYVARGRAADNDRAFRRLFVTSL